MAYSKVVNTFIREESTEEKKVIDNVLRGTLYEIWKTLNGVEARYSGKMYESDEKEVKYLLNRVQAFIDKKGGVEYRY